jgi:hypothetical protein
MKKEKISCFGDRQHTEAEKVKVLMHRPKRAETAEVPKPAEARAKNGRRARIKEISRATEDSEPAARNGAAEGVRNS